MVSLPRIAPARAAASAGVARVQPETSEGFSLLPPAPTRALQCRCSMSTRTEVHRRTAIAVISRSRELDIRSRIQRSHELRYESHRLLAWTAALSDDMRALMAHSASVIWRSRWLAPPGINGGSDDAGLVVSVLAGGATICAPCIAKQARIPQDDIEPLLAAVGESLLMESRDALCEVCLTARKVYQLADSAKAQHLHPARAADGIILFLREHAGDEFGAACLSRRLFNGRSIDHALNYVEAQGIVRHHGRCAECGLKRLVASVPR